MYELIKYLISDYSSSCILNVYLKKITYFIFIKFNIILAVAAFEINNGVKVVQIIIPITII